MDPAQYECMLSELLDLYQNYPSEDEIMMQYLLPALCKACAVLKLVGWSSLPLRLCLFVYFFVSIVVDILVAVITVVLAVTILAVVVLLLSLFARDESRKS